MTDLRRSSLFLIAMAGLAWVGNALYALGAPDGILKSFSPALVAIALLVFTFNHGALRYGRLLMMRFAIIVFATAWFFETLSVITGFPFGRYHYTDLMAPFLGHVPVFVLPAYLVMGYAAWTLATLILGERGAGLSSPATRRVPVLAACLMVLWDLSMDPLRSTVEGRWVWIDGGAHFGVPVSNYFGWFLVTWLMFQFFALQLGRVDHTERPDLTGEHRYWMSVPLAYAAFAGEYLLNPFTGYGHATSIVNGAETSTQDIFSFIAILSFFTLLPAMVIGLVLTVGPSRSKKERNSSQPIRTPVPTRSRALK